MGITPYLVGIYDGLCLDLDIEILDVSGPSLITDNFKLRRFWTGSGHLPLLVQIIDKKNAATEVTKLRSEIYRDPDLGP